MDRSISPRRWLQPRHGHGQGLHPQRHRQRREPRGREHLKGGRRGDRGVHRVRVVDVRRSQVHAAQHHVLQQPGPARAGARRRRRLVAHPSRDLKRVAEPQARLAGGGELREGQDHVGADQARCRERRLSGIGVAEHDLSGDFVGEVGSAVVLADQEQRRGDAGERDLLVRQGRRRGVDGCRLRGRHVVRHLLLQPDGQGGPVERMTVLVGAIAYGAERECRVRRRTQCPRRQVPAQVRVAAIGEAAAVPGVRQRVAARVTGADDGRHQRREHGGRDGEPRHLRRTRVRERRHRGVELRVGEQQAALVGQRAHGILLRPAGRR